MADNSNKKVVTLLGLKYLVSEIKDNFQPKGKYLTTEQAEEQFFKKSDNVNVDLSGYLTTKQADNKYQFKGEYAYKSDLNDYMKKSDNVNIDLSNYATKVELSSKANKDSVYSKEESDNKYQLKGDYVTTSVLDANYLKKSDKISLADYATKVYVDETFQPKGNYTTLTETDTKYQPKGEYITSSAVDAKIVNSLTNFAEKSYVENKIKEVVGTAPEALDTLQELATALNNNKDFATTVTNELADKASKSELTSATSGLAKSSDVYTKKQADDTFLKKAETPTLNGYLSKAEADTTYQPKGSYALSSDLTALQSTVEGHTVSLSQVYTKDESDRKYQVKGTYLTLPEARDRFQSKGAYATISALDNKADKSSLLTKANASDVYTKKQADQIFLQESQLEAYSEQEIKSIFNSVFNN